MKTEQHGFTLIELLTGVAIVAILGAIALVGYQEYATRAAAADIVSAHHNIRQSVLAQGGKAIDDCAALARTFDTKLLNDPYARLSYGFEAVPGGGFRPVLGVCATAERNARNVPVARRAHDSLAATGVVEKGAVLTGSVVSYALRLTEGDAAMCKTAPAQAASTCGATSGAPSPVQPAGTVPAATVPMSQADCQPHQLFGNGKCNNVCNPGWYRVSDPDGQNPRCSSTPPQPVVSPQPVAAAQPGCPAGQQMMTLNVGGSWQRGCQPVCARGQQLNPATKQCDVDHGVAPQTTATTGQTQMPAQVRQQVLAAEQQLAQTMASVATLDDAIAQTMAATQGLPPDALTQSIPGNSAVGRTVRVNCKLPEFPDGACKDQVMGNFCATTGAANTGNCNIAVMCPKTLGVCQGVTAEMRRIFDQSMQRIANDWFAQHPGCTKFGQTGC